MQHYRWPTWAQGEMVHLPAESGPEREENKDKPKSNHFIAKAPYRPTLEAQRTSPTENGPIWPQKGAATPRDWLLPYWLLLAPSFAGCFLPPLQCQLHGCFAEDLHGQWRSYQDRKACKEAQLHSISTIQSYDSLIQGLWWRGTWIADMAHWVASTPSFNI
jgi:hypothetical protein